MDAKDVGKMVVVQAVLMRLRWLREELDERHPQWHEESLLAMDGAVLRAVAWELGLSLG